MNTVSYFSPLYPLFTISNLYYSFILFFYLFIFSHLPYFRCVQNSSESLTYKKGHFLHSFIQKIIFLFLIFFYNVRIYARKI
jgi:hypothetical protein